MRSMITIHHNSGTIQTYRADPVTTPQGGILLIHEVWGLVEHTKNVANRLAGEGYIVIAPDILSNYMDVAKAGRLQEDLFNPEKSNETQPKLRELTAPVHNQAFADNAISQLKACFNYLYDLPEVNQKIAVIGFCFGGTYSYSLAVNEARLKLAIPFYGHADFSVEDLRKIKCPIRAFYGERDANLIKALPELKDNMKTAGVDFKAEVYESAGHAFFNDTNKFAYNEQAAQDSWQKVKNYLHQYV